MPGVPEYGLQQFLCCQYLHLHHNSIVTRTVGITGLQKAGELLSNFVLVLIYMMTFNPGGDACNANRYHAFKTTALRRVFLNFMLCVKCASLERLHKVPYIIP